MISGVSCSLNSFNRGVLYGLSRGIFGIQNIAHVGLLGDSDPARLCVRHVLAASNRHSSQSEK